MEQQDNPEPKKRKARTTPFNYTCQKFIRKKFLSFDWYQKCDQPTHQGALFCQKHREDK